jgi:hypothetical protein
LDDHRAFKANGNIGLVCLVASRPISFRVRWILRVSIRAEGIAVVVAGFT